MFKDKRNFQQKLELGLEKEDILIDILNLSGIKAMKNNSIDVKDIDIELPVDNIYIDCKYMGTPYHMAFSESGIQAMNCLTISEHHIESYAKKEELGKKVWIACIVDYKDYDVYELLFFPNSWLKSLLTNKSSNGKLHFDRRNGKSFYDFMTYINNLRTIKYEGFMYDNLTKGE